MNPIFDGEFTLQKMTGKGGWTFILLPFIEGLPKTKNGTLKIRGTIDNYELVDFNMWAMKKGNFISLKAEIRKAIKKEQGDVVKVLLFLDDAPAVVEDDFMICLKEEPALLKKFSALPTAKKKELVDWIFSAGNEDLKVARIGKVMEKLELS